jgi:glycosyltransferase involved in cell wall biosynthesis
MRIAQLAPLTESVPPEGYGGTELVVHLLTEELVRRGHEVTLFASGDPRTTAQLVSGASCYLRKLEGANRHRWAAYDINALLRVKNMQQEFDIIHNHMGWQAFPFSELLDIPMVSTNHNPIKTYSQNIYQAYSHLPLVSISDAYRRHNFGDSLNYVATVYNGIEFDVFDRPRKQNPNYLLFLGRICEAKGTADAIKIARKTGLPLKIAGKIDTGDQLYYENEVLPYLDPPDVEYIGEVGFAEKIDLYSGAAAVVYPIAFEEPFGLVMAEALAAGCPVVALDRGSVREILSDGETAVVSKSVDDLVARFVEVERISEDACRRRARTLFGKEQMVAGYEKVFEQLTAGCHSRLVSTSARG